MYGYLRVDEKMLRVYQMHEYRAWYCGICSALGKRFGPGKRVLLRYDDVVLALLYRDCTGRELGMRKHYCLGHPMQCMPIVDQKEILDFTCDISILVHELKCRDDLRDGNLLAALPLPLLAGSKKQVKKRYPQLSLRLERLLALQQHYEAQKCDDIDNASHPTGEMMRQITAAFTQDEHVQRLSYLLGRWIYLMDAWDDMRSDARRKDYNIFLQRRSVGEEILSCVSLSYDALLCAYRECEILKKDELLENIICYGLPAQMQRLQDKRV